MKCSNILLTVLRPEASHTNESDIFEREVLEKIFWKYNFWGKKSLSKQDTKPWNHKRTQNPETIREKTDKSDHNTYIKF